MRLPNVTHRRPHRSRFFGNARLIRLRLWLAMLGALGAARRQRHIAVDAIPRLLPDAAWRVVHIVTQFAAAGICSWAAWLGWGLMQSEREFPLPFVAGIESWVPMLVLPLGFGLLAVRFLLSAFAPRPAEEPAP